MIGGLGNPELGLRFGGDFTKRNDSTKNRRSRLNQLTGLGMP